GVDGVAGGGAPRGRAGASGSRGSSRGTLGAADHAAARGRALDDGAADGDARLHDGNVMDRVRRSTAAWLLVAGLLLPAPVRAHEGPPFPIIVDERVGPYVVSVWTDPDIGIGTFFVVLEPPGDDPLPEGTGGGTGGC